MTNTKNINARNRNALQMSMGYFELHLGVDTALPEKFGKAIHALGGVYSDVRGNSHLCRFVLLPMTAAGVDMAADLLLLYPNSTKMGRSTVITRFNRCNAQDVVRSLTCAQAGVTLTADIGRARGMTFAAREDMANAQEAMRLARPAKLREERETLLKRLAEIDAELAA